MAFLDFLPLVGTAVSGLFGAAGQSSSNSANLEQQRLANQGNMELAKYNNQANVDLWHEQTAYNTPALQMQRFKQAGLNPNLIYSQGTSGNASTAPTMSAPHLSAYTGIKSPLSAIGATVGQLGDTLSTIQSIKNAKYQGDVLKQNAALVQSKVLSQQLDNARKTAEQPYWSANALFKNNQLKYSRDYLDTKIRLGEQAYGYNKSANPQKINNMIKQREVLDSNISVNNMRKKLMDKQILQILQNLDIHSGDAAAGKLGISTGGGEINTLMRTLSGLISKLFH